MRPEAVLAYAAGFFDGEGTIIIAYAKPNGRIGSKENYPRYSLRIMVSQGSPEVLQWHQDQFGGTLRRNIYKRSYDGKAIWPMGLVFKHKPGATIPNSNSPVYDCQSRRN